MNDKPTPADVAEIREVYNTLAPMVLRDYFAGQAMCGMLANGTLPYGIPMSKSLPEDVAIVAFKLADLMLAARNTASVAAQDTAGTAVPPKTGGA